MDHTHAPVVHHPWSIWYLASVSALAVLRAAVNWIVGREVVDLPEGVTQDKIKVPSREKYRLIEVIKYWTEQESGGPRAVHLNWHG